MKKITLLALLLLWCLGMHAQEVLFSENFEDVEVNDQGVGDLPDNWSLYNEDGLTPIDNPNVPLPGLIDEAWKIIQFSNLVKAAVSTSWYADPAGQSDDWMVTPQISLPDAMTYLMFDVSSFSSDYPDTYEILVSTSGNTPDDFTEDPIYTETAPAGGLITHSIPLEDYEGEDIYIAFRNISDDKYALIVDNISVRELPSNDLSLEELFVPQYALIDEDVPFSFSILNRGGEVLNSITVEWTDGEESYSHEYTGLNIDTYERDTLELEPAPSYGNVAAKNITVTASNPNNSEDNDDSNNSLETEFKLVSESVERAVVIEEGTGTWCGYCPRGIVAMEYMYNNPEMFPNFIGIAVHNSDPMMLQEYDNNAGFPGFPSSNVNRTLLAGEVSEASWVNYYNRYDDVLAPASINLESTYDENSRNLTATVTSSFKTLFEEANFRLSVVIVENNVTGTTDGYAQHNYYAGGQLGPLDGYENMPEVIPASEMVYDHVGRALLGGYNGADGSVASSIQDGDVASYEFTYTVPENMDDSQLHAVAMLIDQETGAIANATEMAVGALNTINPEMPRNNFSFYPNPAEDEVHIDFPQDLNTSEVKVSIYNMNGKRVQTRTFENGQNFKLNVSQLASGTYLLSVAADNKSYSKKLLVK